MILQSIQMVSVYCMDSARVCQVECFQNETAYTQTKSENEIHAYWYNIDTNNQS